MHFNYHHLSFQLIGKALLTYTLILTWLKYFQLNWKIFHRQTNTISTRVSVTFFVGQVNGKITCWKFDSSATLWCMGVVSGEIHSNGGALQTSKKQTFAKFSKQKKRNLNLALDVNIAQLEQGDSVHCLEHFTRDRRVAGIFFLCKQIERNITRE